jgi:hypothetical protein
VKRSWLERNPLWKIPLGFLTLIFLGSVLATILVTVIITSFHNSDVYQLVWAKAAENSQVREQIGEPMTAAWFIFGQLNVNGSTGTANLSIPISGPKGKGSIRAVAYKSAGVWRFTYLQVSIDGRPGSIDLLSVQPPAEARGLKHLT